MNNHVHRLIKEGNFGISKKAFIEFINKPGNAAFIDYAGNNKLMDEEALA